MCRAKEKTNHDRNRSIKPEQIITKTKQKPTEQSDEGSSCSLVMIFEKLSYNSYLQHKRQICELTITSELICMKGLDLVTGNFCRITSKHFNNPHGIVSLNS